MYGSRETQRKILCKNVTHNLIYLTESVGINAMRLVWPIYLLARELKHFLAPSQNPKHFALASHSPIHSRTPIGGCCHARCCQP